MTKLRSEVMLVLPNMIMKLLNKIKKNKVPLNKTKVHLDIILVLSNVIIEPLNVRKNM